MFSAPLAQAETEGEQFASGLYDGTIGKMPIRVCFDAGSVTGTYYYLEHLKPIALRPDKDETPGLLVERLGYDDPTGGIWHMAISGQDALSGKWVSAKRNLPIRLKRKPFTKDQFTGPCESPEFLAPRMRGDKVVESEAVFEGVSYTRLRYVAGPQFESESVSIASFALKPEQSGDTLINATLRKAMPDGSGTSNFMQCMGMMHLRWGADGTFHHEVMPELISDRWLGVVHSTSIYCGGAHPSFWNKRRVYDRQSGEEVDPSLFLTDASFVFYDVSSDDPLPQRLVRHVSDELKTAIGKNWSVEGSDCWQEIRDFPGWELGLARNGIVFEPDLPHVIKACGEAVTVPWSQLDGMLSEKGKAVRDSLQ